jgi:hypothetical protein
MPESDWAQFVIGEVPHIEIDVATNVRQATKKVEQEFMTDWSTDLLDLLGHCESPIERLFATNLVALRPENRVLSTIAIKPQVWVYYAAVGPTWGLKTMRLDFLVGLDWRSVDFYSPLEGEYLKEYAFDNASPSKNFVPFFGVECDGRDYHTDFEAVQSDKRRDRMLTTLGLPIIRFTGKEIFHSGGDCALETATLFAQHLRQSLSHGINPEDIIQLSRTKVVQFRHMGLSLERNEEFLEKFAGRLEEG